MSSSDAPKPKLAPLAAGIAMLGVLAGCQAGPLYADAGYGTVDLGAPPSAAAAYQGRVAIAPADDRLGQLVRNPLLFRLNAGTEVRDPLYAVKIRARGKDQTSAIQAVGSDVNDERGRLPLRSNIYRLAATYTVTRVADGEVVAKGERRALVPYDRTNQLYQEDRALIDARQQASDAVAAKIELAIASALVDDRGA